MSENPLPKALLRCVAVIGILFVGSIACVLGPKLYRMKSEYVTADVIRAASRFVTEHSGQWPRSWKDLGGEDLSRYTDFRFDLTVQMLIHDRQLIYSAIQPRCHRYRTYPHARAQLDGLYEKLTAIPSHP